MRRYISGICGICVILIATSCTRRHAPPELPISTIPETPASEVESVIFLVGDAGDAEWQRSPLPHRLAQEVEQWSRTLQRDSAVGVIFLGDNVYPRGLRTEPAYYATDSTKIQTQVDILSGPNARANRSFGIFIAGNHDWGHMFGAAGEQRLRNEEDFLSRSHDRGVNVQLLPKAGTPGPGIMDIGRHIRILLLDTAWWLLSADAAEKQRTMTRLQEQMKKAPGREVIIASHHPYRSSGVHGGLTGFWKNVGVLWLLNRSGAALQDLSSLPYRDLRTRLSAVFRQTGSPLAMLGGHDHSLQLLRGVAPEEPKYILVSGSGSKTTPIGNQEGLIYRSPDPGFMRLVVKKNGGIDLFVFSAPSQYLKCAAGSAADEEKCVQQGIGEFQSRYSLTLK